MYDVIEVPIVSDIDLSAFRDAYVKAIADLQTIQSDNLNTVNKLQTAVKRLAEIQLATLRFLKKQVM